MPRRYSGHSIEFEPPRKKSSNSNNGEPSLKQGEIVTDLSGKSWKLGKAVGIGGFGEIYLASEDLKREVKTDTPFAAKVEKFTNGPLFVEINCYLRIAKTNMIENWKKEKKLKHLGMPHYVASGSQIIGNEKYRFLIIPKYTKDLEVLLQAKKMFNLKTVLTISTQIMDVLEYIHSHGYVHSDIKASNIMLGQEVIPRQTEKITTSKMSLRSPVTQAKPLLRPRRLRNLRSKEVVNYIDDIPNYKEFESLLKHFMYCPAIVKQENKPVDCDTIYLLDFGLASKYLLSNGEHREFSTDERRAHAGTLLFCSRDAHKGVLSRRSDLESLGFNMIYWLTGNLPWADDIEQPDVVERRKIKCMADCTTFLNYCFNGDCPKFLVNYFSHIEKLKFEECPNYELYRNLFRKAVSDYGYKNDLKLDFNNLEGWGNKQKKIKQNRGRENRKIKPTLLISMGPPRIPLNSSNILFKRPKLRKKKNKAVKDSMMNWSKILIDDPEDIVRQARERKNTDGSDQGSPNVLDLDIESMNPTNAMLEIYNKCKEKSDMSPKYKGDSSVDHIIGYTPAMMGVHVRMMENRIMELEKLALSSVTHKQTKRTGKKQVQRKKKGEPTRCSGRTHKSPVTEGEKKDVPQKRAKSVPVRRIYMLRG